MNDASSFTSYFWNGLLLCRPAGVAGPIFFRRNRSPAWLLRVRRICLKYLSRNSRLHFNHLTSRQLSNRNLRRARLRPRAVRGSQSAAQQPGAEKSQHDKAEEQIKEQEKQRTLGILPAFNVSYRGDAVSLTRSQKMKLAFRSATDPVTFGIAFVVAGDHEAFDDNKGFGWGIEGYGKRSGAAYLDAFDGGIIGNGILPSILHQDPRYFRLGHGTVKHRLLYALASNVICKHDNTHKWEPNYSNIFGNIISGALSNLYYPSGSSGIGQTFTNGLTVTAEGGLGSVFQEFWPDSPGSSSIRTPQTASTPRSALKTPPLRSPLRRRMTKQSRIRIKSRNRASNSQSAGSRRL